MAKKKETTKRDIKEVRAELEKATMDLRVGVLKDTSVLKKLRKEIARILTMKEKI